MYCESIDGSDFIIPMLICALFSIILSIFAGIVCFTEFLDYYTSRFILQLAINDIIRSTSLIVCNLGVQQDIISFLGITYTFSNLSTMYWSLYLSTALFSVIIKSNTKVVNYYKYWNIVNYLVLLPLCVLPILTSSYGFFSGLCTIELTVAGDYWKLGLTFVPGWIIVISDLYCFFKIYFRMKNDSNKIAKVLLFNRGFIYVFIIIVPLIVFTITNLFQYIISGCYSIYVIYAAEIIISSHGIINSFALLFNGNLRKIAKFKFRNKGSEQMSLNSSFSDVAGLLQ